MVARVHALSVGVSRACSLRIWLLVLESYQLLIQELLDYIVAFVLLTRLKVPVGLQDLLASMVILSVHMDTQLVWSKTSILASFIRRSMVIVLFIRIDLVTVYYGRISVLGQFVVWLPQLLLSVGV